MNPERVLLGFGVVLFTVGVSITAAGPLLSPGENADGPPTSTEQTPGGDAVEPVTTVGSGDGDATAPDRTDRSDGDDGAVAATRGQDGDREPAEAPDDDEDDRDDEDEEDDRGADDDDAEDDDRGPPGAPGNGGPPGLD